MRTMNSPVETSPVAIGKHEDGPLYSPQLAYHELADVPVQQTDLIEQLNTNLDQLLDLQSRMKFMMKEIRYLMKA
jgi:hypothetical protein